jgi:hypothetical protein
MLNTHWIHKVGFMEFWWSYNLRFFETNQPYTLNIDH